MRIPLVNATPVTRRVLLALAAGGLAPKRPAVADTSPLWPRDGLFPDCTQPSACVSSQDDRPQTWDNPWVFDGSVEDSFSALSRTLTSKKMNGKIVAADGERYLRVEYVNSGSNLCHPGPCQRHRSSTQGYQRSSINACSFESRVSTAGLRTRRRLEQWRWMTQSSSSLPKTRSCNSAAHDVARQG